jgi:hypothetical protein
MMKVQEREKPKCQKGFITRRTHSTMVHERVLPASRLANLGRGVATRAFDLCSDLRAIDRHHRRIHGVDHVVFDEDRLITHILDCVGALRRMQRLFDTSTESVDGGDDAADALQVAREAVFMKALHLMLSCDDGTDAVGAMVGAFPGFGDLTSSPSSSASSASASSSAPGAQKRSWQPVHWAMLSAASIAQASGRGSRASPRPRHHAQQVPAAAAAATTVVPPDVDVVRVLVDHDPSALVLSQFGADPSASLLGGVFIPHWQEQHSPADILVMQPAPYLEVTSVRDTAHGSLPTSFVTPPPPPTSPSPSPSPSSSLHTHIRWCGSWGT